MKFVRESEIKSTPVPETIFSPGVWWAEPLPADKEGGLRGHRFVYQPGGRSHWHTHDGEQALIVLSGRGLVGVGEPHVTEVGPGDWVHVMPGEKHWHGAVSDNTFVHLAVTATGGTEFHEPVDDATYGDATTLRWARASEDVFSPDETRLGA